MLTNARKAKINWSLLAATRFLLSMIVLNAHLSYFQTNAFTRFIAMFGARSAVVGFFVVSGFSVASSFDRNSKGFLTRRLLRIYPAYLFATIFAIGLEVAIGSYHAKGIEFSHSGLLVIVGNLFLVQKYLVGVLSFNPVYWSLSIEFSYYILLKLYGNIDGKYLVILFLFSITYFVLPANLSKSQVYYLFEKLFMVRCLWPFIVGVTLSRYPSTPMYLAVTILGLAATSLSDWTEGPLQWATYLLTIGAIYIAQCGLLRNSIVMDRLGDMSYPIYLVHVPVGILFAAVLGVTSPWAITSAVLILSAFVTFVVENPFRTLLKRLGSFRILHERQLAIPENNPDRPSSLL